MGNMEVDGLISGTDLVNMDTFEANLHLRPTLLMFHNLIGQLLGEYDTYVRESGENGENLFRFKKNHESCEPPRIVKPQWIYSTNTLT